MKKIVPIIISLLLMCSCSLTRKPPSQGITGNNTTHPAEEVKLTVSDYFPFTKDVHKIYSGTGNEYAGFETYVEYVRNNLMQLRINNGGTNSIVVYSIKDGELKRVYSMGEVYYRYDFTSMSGDEEVLIKEPIKVGTLWTIKNGDKRSITSVDKNISTSAGNFKALEVKTEGTDYIIYDYYAKGSGLIKRVFSSKPSDGIVTSQLEKVEKGVPYSHRVRLYFPQFLKDRIVYIDRDVKILTNENMKFKFQKELKTIPQDTSLSKVLTSKVQVLGIKLDRNSGIVTVDFSPNLVADMNAGSGFESMIIKCIVNTFGGYYQVDKVIITLDGKPYISGHIELKPGEYFKVDTSNTVKY